MGWKQKKSIMKKRLKHARMRLRERHGLWLSEYDICQLVDQIHSGESTFLVRFSKNFTLHRVSHGSCSFPVVYSKRHDIILTVYYNKWVGKKKDGTYKMKPRR